MDFFKTDPLEIRVPRLVRLPDGRWRMWRYYRLPGACELKASDSAKPTFPKAGTPFAWTHNTSELSVIVDAGIDPSTLRLISVAEDGSTQAVLTIMWEQLHPTDETFVGGLRIVTESDGREFVVAQFLQFYRNPANDTVNPYVRGAIGSDIPTECGYDNGPAVLDRVTCVNDGTLRTITRYYLKASSTPQILGDTTAAIADPRAFVDTVSGEIVAGTTLFSREWTVRFLVAGDASIGDTHWFSVSASRSFGSRVGKLTNTRIERQGLGYSIIVRVYTEIPDRLVRHVRDNYTFPGELGLDGPEPYVSKPSTTRETTIEVEEIYYDGEPAPQTLEFEVLWWAQGSINFTPKGGTETGSKPYSFPGVIGSVTITLNDRYFNGYLCAVLAGVIESNPTDYPSGRKRISSRPAPWRGDIWKLTNLYVTFP